MFDAATTNYSNMTAAQGAIGAPGDHPPATMLHMAKAPPYGHQQQPPNNAINQSQGLAAQMAGQAFVTDQQQRTIHHSATTHQATGDPVIVQQQNNVAKLPILKRIIGHLGWYRFAGALTPDPFEPGTSYTTEKFLFRYIEATENGALDGQAFNEKDGKGKVVGRKIFKAKKGDQITEDARIELENLKDSLNADFNAYLEPQMEKRFLQLAIQLGVHVTQNGVSTADVLHSCRNISMADDAAGIASIVKLKTFLNERNFMLQQVYSFFAEKGLMPVILKPLVGVKGSLWNIQLNTAGQKGTTGLYWYQQGMFGAPRQLKRKITAACPQSKQRKGGTRQTLAMQLAARNQLLSQLAGLVHCATTTELTPSGNTLDLIKALLEEAKIGVSTVSVTTSDKGDDSDTVAQQPSTPATAGMIPHIGFSSIEREATTHAAGQGHDFTQEELQGMSSFRVTHQDQPSIPQQQSSKTTPAASVASLKAPPAVPPLTAPAYSVTQPNQMRTVPRMSAPVPPPPPPAAASVQEPHKISGCAAGKQCLMPDIKVAPTHTCPACRVDMHAICGTNATSESTHGVKYMTTCSPCVGNFGRAFSSPEEFAQLANTAPPVPPEPTSLAEPAGCRTAPIQSHKAPAPQMLVAGPAPRLLTEKLAPPSHRDARQEQSATAGYHADQFLLDVASTATTVAAFPVAEVSTEQLLPAKIVADNSDEVRGGQAHCTDTTAAAQKKPAKKKSKEATEESNVSIEQSPSTDTSDRVGGKRRANANTTAKQPRKKVSKSATTKPATEEQGTPTLATEMENESAKTTADTSKQCHRDHSDLSSFEDFDLKGYFVPGARFHDAVCLACKAPGRPAVLNGVFKACKGYPHECDMAWCGEVACAQACPALQGSTTINEDGNRASGRKRTQKKRHD